MCVCMRGEGGGDDVTGGVRDLLAALQDYRVTLISLYIFLLKFNYDLRLRRFCNVF